MSLLTPPSSFSSQHSESLKCYRWLLRALVNTPKTRAMVSKACHDLPGLPLPPPLLEHKCPPHIEDSTHCYWLNPMPQPPFTWCYRLNCAPRPHSIC